MYVLEVGQSSNFEIDLKLEKMINQILAYQSIL